jgi:dolichyl-phosphate-mannose--protein O-mannosyl transferase
MTGITLGCACSCKNTAWGLIAFDAFAYCLSLGDMASLSILDYIGELVAFGIPLAALCLVVYVIIFSVHFILLPYAGPGICYLYPEMKNQLIPNNAAGDGLFARRLQPPGLISRSLLLTVRMHRGNMGIQQFHDSQSFPKHWPVLGSVSVFFWSGAHCEIRCLGNAFSYYLALAGVIGSTLAVARLHARALRLAVGYAVCYFPFYFIPRVLYLYHYIIPLMFGCLAFGAAVDVWLPVRARGAVVVLAVAACCFGFWLWSPYVYGTPMHDRAVMVWSRNWIDGDLEHRSRRAAKH